MDDKRFEGPDAPLPATTGYLAYHAQARPNQIAIIDSGQEITYGHFFLDVCRMRQYIESLALAPNALIAVQSSQFYLQWVVLLACECLGLNTVSFSGKERKTLGYIIDKADRIFVAPHKTVRASEREVVIDNSWYGKISQLSPDLTFDPVHEDKNSPLRLVKSSGTTGQMKLMTQTANSHDFRVGQCQLLANFDENTRCFLAMEFTVQSMQGYATACLREGGTCIMDKSIPLHKALVQYDVTHLVALPVHLDPLLKIGVHDKNVQKGLLILSGGAPVSQSVRAYLKNILGASVVETYGSNEVGYVCAMHANRYGAVLPKIQVQVVDDNDQPVFKQLGQVRIKSEACVEGYLNDDDATRKMFRDGWFYPSDIGVMSDDRTLQLVGRSDNLLNIKGIKYQPEELEKELLEALPVTEVCITMNEDHLGDRRVCIVIACEDASLHEEIRSRLKGLTPAFFADFQVTFMTAIPRTETGKVMRNRLNVPYLN